jgi:hypothetical protein
MLSIPREQSQQRLCEALVNSRCLPGRTCHSRDAYVSGLRNAGFRAIPIAAAAWSSGVLVGSLTGKAATAVAIGSTGLGAELDATRTLPGGRRPLTRIGPLFLRLGTDESAFAVVAGVARCRLVLSGNCTHEP